MQFMLNALTLRFRLFGVPTSISPMTWLILALLGGGFGISHPDDVMHVLLFIVAGIIAILFHEYGHALTSRRLAGAYPEVVIEGFGGYASHAGARFTRWTYFWTVFAGPLAGLIPGAVAVVFLGIQTGAGWEAMQYAFYSSFCSLFTANAEIEGNMTDYIVKVLAGDQPISVNLFIFYNQLFFVSFIWTVFNLVPLYPLDGNKMLGSILNNDYAAATVGVIISIPFCLWAFQTGSFITIIIVVYLAYLNFQFYSALRRMRQ